MLTLAKTSANADKHGDVFEGRLAPVRFFKSLERPFRGGRVRYRAPRHADKQPDLFGIRCVDGSIAFRWLSRICGAGTAREQPADKQEKRDGDADSDDVYHVVFLMPNSLIGPTRSRLYAEWYGSSA